jgi:hypothetical protein
MTIALTAGAIVVVVLMAYGCGYDRAIHDNRRDFAAGYRCGRRQGRAEAVPVARRERVLRYEEENLTGVN